jgi:hypothetical protein
MKKLIIAASMAAMCACAPKVKITVENTLDIDRQAELVEIPVERLGAIVLAEGETYLVGKGGHTIASQVTSDGLLIFQSGLGAGEKKTFTVRAGAPEQFAPKTYGRFAPERMDDFIWENDRVAFRIYGAALVAKDGSSNGIDALYKRSDSMVLDKWYEDYFSEAQLSYHDDNGTGLDNYDVKRSLGAGAAAPLVDGQLVLNSNFRRHEVVDNGPLRTTFRLTYPGMQIGEGVAGEVRKISIDAGSQLTRVEQQWGVSHPMTVAMGYPLRTADEVYAVSGNTLMVNEPATPKASGVYLGAVMSGGFDSAVENEYEVPEGEKAAGTYRHILLTTTYNPGKPMVYYTGFGWEKWGDWTAEKFAQYLADFDAALGTPFVVDIE